MSISQTYKIKGMHCASCANIIEKTLNKTSGVNSIQVNYGTETAKIDFDEYIGAYDIHSYQGIDA